MTKEIPYELRVGLEVKFDFESLQRTEYFGNDGFSFPDHTPGKFRNDDLTKFAHAKANREYRMRNPEKPREWRASYEAKLSPEEKVERHRRYQRTYQKKNRKKVNEKNRRYRARKKAKATS